MTNAPGARKLLTLFADQRSCGGYICIADPVSARVSYWYNHPRRPKDFVPLGQGEWDAPDSSLETAQQTFRAAFTEIMQQHEQRTRALMAQAVAERYAPDLLERWLKPMAQAEKGSPGVRLPNIREISASITQPIEDHLNDKAWRGPCPDMYRIATLVERSIDPAGRIGNEMLLTMAGEIAASLRHPDMIATAAQSAAAYLRSPQQRAERQAEISQDDQATPSP
jgi:hypothetical protein